MPRCLALSVLQSRTVAMHARTHSKVQETRGNSILALLALTHNDFGVVLPQRYTGTKVEYDQVSGSAHRRMPTCRLPLWVGGLFVCCEDHRPIPTFKRKAVTNAALLQLYTLPDPCGHKRINCHSRALQRMLRETRCARQVYTSARHLPHHCQRLKFKARLQTGAVTQCALTEPLCGTQKVS